MHDPGHLLAHGFEQQDVGVGLEIRLEVAPVVFPVGDGLGIGGQEFGKPRLNRDRVEAPGGTAGDDLAKHQMGIGDGAHGIGTGTNRLHGDLLELRALLVEIPDGFLSLFIGRNTPQVLGPGRFNGFQQGVDLTLGLGGPLRGRGDQRLDGFWLHELVEFIDETAGRITGTVDERR